ncbi:MAG: hypothetical protein AMJ53_05565 [Gammaproteobacteria bacterium SG8_11]|nr:MAG: hypothetical protein AMJ53_05565 [Gammaproteobacteria bacterium SG8_11]
MNKASTLPADRDQNAANLEGADNEINHEHVRLARTAAQGDPAARKTVNELVQNIIAFQTDRFCKRFCRENQYYYLCTLPKPWGSPPKDAPLCEWGNASYAWMLEDLTNANRLLQYEGKHGARLNDYIYRIANSLPFYERWKDWRFGRKVHVPTYIQDMSPDAGKVFLALRSGDAIANIAQRLGKSETHTESLCQRIVIELTKRNRLHLLDPPTTVSLSTLNQDDDEDGSDADIPCFDLAPEQQETNAALWQAWKKLSTVEQFVLEAMLIDEQDANDVLSALVKLDISITDGVPAQQTNRQQLYYFRRKTLAKLAQRMDEG